MSLDRFNGRPIYPLASKTDLTAWVDYLPVKQESAGRANSTDNTGFFSASAILSTITAGTTSADRDGLAASQTIDTAASADGLAADQTRTATVALTLEAVAAALVPPRHVTLTSATNESATNFVIVGFNQLGVADSETLAGPNANTVVSTKVYSVVTTITPSATDAVDTVSAGWSANTVPYPMTLNGVSGNGFLAQSDIFAPALVTLYSTGNVSTITFAIAGLNADGAASRETITGPNNSTVATLRQFTRVDSVTPSDDLITVAVEVGIESPAETEWTDYVPVFVEAGYTIPWSTAAAAGYIPFEDVTP